MTFTYVLQLAKQYMVLGLTGMLAAILVMVFFSIFYHKLVRQEDKRLAWSNFVATGLLIGYYIVVIGATILSRARYSQSMAQLGLFETYRDAWYDVDLVEWRNMILNILMFCPIGFLLPFTLKCFRKPWVTYLGGFVGTLIIECTQYVLRCGVFQTDDLLNNFVGTMIGYGFFCVVIWIKNLLLGRKRRTIVCLCSQIPLAISILAFLSIYIIYQCKPYGNLHCENIRRYDLSSIELTSSTNFSDEEQTGRIAYIETLSRKEAYNLAKELFWSTGKQISDNDCHYYDETATFYSANRESVIWVKYQGAMYDYEDYTQKQDSHGQDIALNAQAEEAEIRNVLLTYGISVPEEAVFVNNQDGSYTFLNTISPEKEENEAGQLTLSYTVNGMISSLSNGMLHSITVDTCGILSQQKVYDQIAEGKFYNIETEEGNEMILSGVHTMEFTEVELNYILDSKGYLRPVYRYTVLCNGQKGYLTKSCMK